MIKAKTGLLAVALLAATLAGCAGEKSGPSAEGDAGPHGGANETVQASINVTVDGNTTAAENGSIPLKTSVNVTFDGRASVGSNLTFAWDFGDNATSTNATEEHAYQSPGEYNVTLTVSAGNQTDVASIRLNVTAGGPAPGTPAGPDKKTFTGSLTFGNPNACSSGINPALANYDCRDHKIVIGPSSPDGTPATAKTARIKMTTSSAGALQMTIYLYGPGNVLLKSASNAPPASAGSLSINHEADMPPGEYTVRVRLNAGGNVSYSVEAEIGYVAT